MLCIKILRMSFIGDFSLQNIKPNFKRQTKKQIVDVSLSAGKFVSKVLNSGVLRNTKEEFEPAHEIMVHIT